MTHSESRRDQLPAGLPQADVEVDDQAELDEAIPSVRYDITSYGADYDVDGYVKRLKRGEIFIPEFQRGYVWNQPQASRFVESLLLGLPVPGVFLAKDTRTEKLLVIDGQQRLKTLQFFTQGYFAPRPDEKTQRIFALQRVQERFEGKTYDTLDQRDRLRLDNSIVHATIVRQDQPPEDDTSIYHIFERLNSGGRLLAPQEIRRALYHGPLMDLVTSLNSIPAWRQIFGRTHARLKDEELVLRFLAMHFEFSTYRQPMSEFISKFAGKHQHAPTAFLDDCRRLFTASIETVAAGIGTKAFRPERALNAAVFDSVMVGLVRRLETADPVDEKRVAIAYKRLLEDTEYIAAVSRATANETTVDLRLTKATESFAQV